MWENEVIFKIFGVIVWLTNKYNTNIARNERSKGNQIIKFGQLIKYNGRNTFPQKLCRK